MNAKRLRIQSVKVKFHVGENVRISKQKLKFANASEQNFSTEIFRISKIFIELQDLSMNWKI